MADRFTFFRVEYDVIDTTAASDASPTPIGNIGFDDITLLSDEYTPTNILTLERNVNVLDGTRVELDENDVQLAYMTEYSASSTGVFSTDPTIQIAFSTFHSSFALTIDFLPMHPLSARVTWKSNQTILYSDTYNITSDRFVIQQSVELYNYIEIEFETAYPTHYVKIQKLTYGTTLHWDEDNIKSGKLVQELNPISDKISVNTLSFDVVDVSDEMNFGNESGLHNFYQRNQELRPYETIDDTEISLGRYFLDTFSNETNLGKMSAVSYLGLLDSIQYNEGVVYNGTLAGEILEDIFTVAHVEDYVIDAETYNQPMYGTIRPMSCRNAIKEVLFACNSIIDTTNRDQIVVTKRMEIIDGAIGREIKFSTKATKQDYYSGVEIKYTNLTSSQNLTEISKGTYEEGTYSIIFTEPYTNLSITGGTITSSSTYYVNFTVPVDGEVIISGYGYDAITQSIVAERDYVAPGQYRGIKSFSTTLCNANYASILADKLLEYYTKNEMKIEVKYLANSSVINIRKIIENSSQGYRDYVGRYVKRSLDLTGGFIDNAEFVGYFDIFSDYYHAGNELYADDNFLL